MNGESGYVMIELILMLMVVALCTRMCVPMMNLHKRGDEVKTDVQEMIELWKENGRCSVYCPKKDVLPDIISLK